MPSGPGTFTFVEFGKASSNRTGACGSLDFAGRAVVAIGTSRIDKCLFTDRIRKEAA